MMTLSILNAQGQKVEPASQALKSFQGVSEFAVIVDCSGLPDLLKTAKALIEAEVQQHLSASPKLRRVIVTPPSTKTPFGSLWISTRIKCGDASVCAATVSVSFQQSVQSLVRERAQFPVATWMRQELLVEPEPEILLKTRETLAGLLNLFVSDFLQANP